MQKVLALAATLVFALALAWRIEQTPRPLAADAPADQFSAGRALVDVRAVAARPHPIGSAANAAARDYLLARMQSLGLEPEVQRIDAVHVADRIPTKAAFASGGVVENLVGVLPGRDREAPALVLMAHYDSVPGSPGAADDAAGVGSLLEITRLLKRQGAPARDVILLLTDGEEAGLLGAHAFFERHPLAAHAGYVINLETRGGGGRVQMFQTGAGNAHDISLVQRTARRPLASSLTVFLYKRMPNDTDFSVSDRAGVPGLNYAFIGKQFDYHSPTSTADNLSLGSLQHMGEEALGPARAAAFDPALPARGDDAVYSNLLGPPLAAYAPALGWPLLVLAAALCLYGGWRARKSGRLVWIDLAQGLGTGLYLVTVSATLLHLARRATGVAHGFMEQRLLLAQAGRWEITLALVGIGALVFTAACAGRGRSRFAAATLAGAAGLAASLFGGFDPLGLGLGAGAAVLGLLSFGRPSGTAGTWAGLLAIGFLLVLVLQILAPTTAFLVAWPLLLAGALGAATDLGSARRLWTLPILAIGGGLGLAWMFGYAHGVYLGLDLPELLALFVWIGALMCWPLAHAEDADRKSRTIALALLFVAFCMVAVVRFHPPWTDRHPQSDVVQYVVDTDTGQARRVALTPDLSDWASKVLAADGGVPAKIEAPALSRRPVWAASAPAVPAAPAAITFARGEDGTVAVRAAPPTGARVLNLRLRSSVEATDVRINGRPAAILTHAGEWTTLRWAAAPEGVDISFRPKGSGALELTFGAVTEAWPATARPLPRRPAGVAGFDLGDSLVATGARRFTW